MVSYPSFRFFFLTPSYLGTAVASVRTHAHYSHHPCTNKPTTTLRSEDRVLLEITEILWFHRRRARHDPIVASCVRGRRLEPSKRRLYSRGINPRGWGTRRVSALEPGWAAWAYAQLTNRAPLGSQLFGSYIQQGIYMFFRFYNLVPGLVLTWDPIVCPARFIGLLSCTVSPTPHNFSIIIVRPS
jgi:hypothetical protein